MACVPVFYAVVVLMVSGQLLGAPTSSVKRHSTSVTAATSSPETVPATTNVYDTPPVTTQATQAATATTTIQQQTVGTLPATSTMAATTDIATTEWATTHIETKAGAEIWQAAAPAATTVEDISGLSLASFISRSRRALRARAIADVDYDSTSTMGPATTSEVATTFGLGVETVLLTNVASTEAVTLLAMTTGAETATIPATEYATGAVVSAETSFSDYGATTAIAASTAAATGVETSTAAATQNMETAAWPWLNFK